MKQSGFTVVELMVTLGIAGVLLGMGIPAFNAMLASSQSRSVAESIMSGLRLARSEAIKRNVPIRFQMVSTLDNGCVYSDSTSLWVVTQGDGGRGLAQGFCGSAPYTPPDQPDICSPNVPACSDTVSTACRGVASATNPNPITCSDDPLIAYKSDQISYRTINVAGTGGGGAASVVTFGPLGRVSTNSVGGASINTIDVVPNNSSAKSWRIRIEPTSGSLRLCDPAAATTEAQACPP